MSIHDRSAIDQDELIDNLLDRLEQIRSADSDLPLGELVGRDAALKAQLDADPEVACEVERRFRALEIFNRHLTGDAAQDSPPTVPGYQILGLLGSGGVGAVYRARQLSLGREVALKVILAGKFASPRTRQRFRLEAAATAQLSHHRIVQVYETGEVDGFPFLVEELIEGQTLAERIAGRPQSPKKSAIWVAAIAEAVEHAHRAGIIHRDLKPSNILVGLNGQPKVTDFGLAKMLNEEASLTRTGESLGTVQYMAPEQVGGKTVGVATDVYGLGAILYELLTGRPPFAGSTIADTIQQVQTQDPVPPRSLVAQVPRDLDAVVLRCLAKDPRARYASAAELAKDLDRFLGGEPTRARPLSNTAKLVRWARRRPSAAALVGVSAAATLLIVFGSLWYSKRLGDALAETQVKQIESEARRQQVEQQQEVMRRHLYAADLYLAARSWTQSNIEQTLILLDRHRPQPGQEDLRGFLWYYLDRLCHKERLCFDDIGGEMYTVAFAPDGRRLAAGGHDGLVRIWDAQNGELLHALAAGPGEITSVVYSPDGRRLYSGGDDGALKSWDLDSLPASSTPQAPLPPTRASPRHKAHLLSIALSPDGRLVATGGRDHLIKLSEVDADSTPVELAGHTDDVSAVTFSPDGARLASAGHSDHVVLVWNVADGSRCEPPLKHPDDVYAVAYSPDGQLLATACADGAIRLWETAGQTLREPVFARHRDRVEGIAFIDQGRQLVSTGRDTNLHVWDVPGSRLQGTIHGHRDWTWGVAASPDGRSVASASSDGTVRVWDLPGALDPQKLGQTDAEILALAASHDGRTLAVATADSRLELWTIDGQRQALAHDSKRPVTALQFSREGNRLAAADATGRVRIWDLPSGAVTATLCGQVGAVQSLAFSADGQFLAVGCGAFDPWAHVWDLSRTPARATRIPLEFVRHVAMPQHGSSLVFVATDSHSDNTNNNRARQVGEYDWARQRPSNAFAQNSDDLGYLAVSADGRLIACNRHLSGLELRDLPGGRLRGKLALVGATSAAFSCDGQTLASGGKQGDVRLWNLFSQQEVMELAHLPGAVTRLEFHKGRLFACVKTTQGQGEVYYWEASGDTPFAPVVEARLVEPPAEGSPKSRVPTSSSPAMAEDFSAMVLRKQLELVKVTYNFDGRFFDDPHEGRMLVPTMRERVVEGVVQFSAVEIFAPPMLKLLYEPRLHFIFHDSEVPSEILNVPNCCRSGDLHAKGGRLSPVLFADVFAGPDQGKFRMFYRPPAEAVERSSIPARQLSAHTGWHERYSVVQQWAVQHGYPGAFPTFNDTTEEGQPHYGVILVKPGCGREVWVPANAIAD